MERDYHHVPFFNMITIVPLKRGQTAVLSSVPQQS